MLRLRQLHALFRALLAGGAPTGLSAADAGTLLRTVRTVRPVGQVERVRKQLAGDLVAEIRSLDARLKSNAEAMAELVKTSGISLTQTVGIGDITAARLIGRTGRPSRFPTAAAYATYSGVAPLEVASAD